MSKMMKVLIAVSLAGVSSIGLAQTSGTSGNLGSAGLGIDTAALTIVSGGANPSISLGKIRRERGLGGPIAGLREFFENKRARGNSNAP